MGIGILNVVFPLCFLSVFFGGLRAEVRIQMPPTRDFVTNKTQDQIFGDSQASQASDWTVA